MKCWEEMNIFISHISALNYYRNARIYYDISNSYSNIQLEKSNSTHMDDIDFDALPYIGDSNKIDLLVSNTNFRHINKRVNYVLSKKRFPYGSFIKYRKNIYVCSPELTFCQLASKLDKESLLLLGMEWCGNYSLSDSFECGFASAIKPLTTPDRILAFAKRLHQQQKHTQGISSAIKISKYLKLHSASPQESILFVKLCLPRKFGSYGLSGFDLNEQIKLSEEAYNILGRTTIRPDLCNKKTKVAIEYDSEAFHSDYNQNVKDKLRLDALRNDGWKLYSFVKPQMNDVYKFDAMAKSILKANGQDSRIRTKDFESKRRNLWKNLL